MKGWIGVDLDGVLAEYHSWRGKEHIGDPLPKMVEQVKQWIVEGKDVRIFTARVSPISRAANGDTYESVADPIRVWCERHLGRALPITHEKDLHMIELYDDRCVQMITNTGVALEDAVRDSISDVIGHLERWL